MRLVNLLVVKVLEGDGHLILALLVEDYLKSTRVVVDLKQSAHGLLLLRGHTTHDNDLAQSKG